MSTYASKHHLINNMSFRQTAREDHMKDFNSLNISKADNQSEFRLVPAVHPVTWIISEASDTWPAWSPGDTMSGVCDSLQTLQTGWRLWSAREVRCDPEQVTSGVPPPNVNSPIVCNNLQLNTQRRVKMWIKLEFISHTIIIIITTRQVPPSLTLRKTSFWYKFPVVFRLIMICK